MGTFLSKNSSNDPKLPKTTKTKRPAATVHNDSANTTDITILPDESITLAPVAADTYQRISAAVIGDANADDSSNALYGTPQQLKFIDPRSPFVCRTPIDGLGSPTGSPSPQYAVTKQLDLTTDESILLLTPCSKADGTGAAVHQKTILQQKLLKNFGYQDFDPRSPTQFINRTPMRLTNLAASTSVAAMPSAEILLQHAAENIEESNNVLNESLRSAEDMNNDVNESIQAIAVPSEYAIESTDIEDDSGLYATPKTIDVEVIDDSSNADPRSPSDNVDRTPIVLQHAERVFDVAAFASVMCNDNENIENHPSSPPQTPKAATKSNRIFEDALDDVTATSTPVAFAVRTSSIAKKLSNDIPTPRTPLGCLGNRGRQSLLPSAGGAATNKQSVVKHPILFIGQQQQQATHRKSLAQLAVVSTLGKGNVAAVPVESKIPVLKMASNNAGWNKA